MKFLVDANISPQVVTSLIEAGFEAKHVGDVGMMTASDDEIFDFGERHGYAIATADSDFPMLAALRAASAPSVVLMRHVSELPPREHAALLIANLPVLVEVLEKGAIVSLSPSRMRVRDLPLG